MLAPTSQNIYGWMILAKVKNNDAVPGSRVRAVRIQDKCRANLKCTFHFTFGKWQATGTSKSGIKKSLNSRLLRKRNKGWYLFLIELMSRPNITTDDCPNGELVSWVSSRPDGHWRSCVERL